MSNQQQQAGVELSDAERIMAALDSGDWSITRNQPHSSFTDEANQKYAWSVRRERPPMCSEDGTRCWSGSTAIAALEWAAADLRMTLPKVEPARVAHRGKADETDSYDALWTAFQKIDNHACSLPQFKVISEGGLEAVTENIIAAMLPVAGEQRGKVEPVAFEQAWSKMEAKGYRYGKDALEQVRFGWNLATEALAAPQAEKAPSVQNHNCPPSYYGKAIHYKPKDPGPSRPLGREDLEDHEVEWLVRRYVTICHTPCFNSEQQLAGVIRADLLYALKGNKYDTL